MKKQQTTAGFTLIELLVVIAVIGLLASVVMASLSSARAKARDARRLADLKQISLAIELFYDANGYYPQSDCGFDCNGYRYSYSSGSWAGLAADLAPYIPTLPVDPVNSACPPWGANCYSYSYGNVGRNTQRVQYDLTAQFETAHPYRCSVRSYFFYFNQQPWCGPYSNQIYEASPD